MKGLRMAWGIDLYKTQVVTWPLTVKLERLKSVARLRRLGIGG
jgi:hypothetical protein